MERLRLAVVAPDTIRRPCLVANVADDMILTIRLLIRRFVGHGTFKLGSLPPTVRPELADEVELANVTDNEITKLFVDK